LQTGRSGAPSTHRCRVLPFCGVWSWLAVSFHTGCFFRGSRREQCLVSHHHSSYYTTVQYEYSRQNRVRIQSTGGWTGCGSNSIVKLYQYRYQTNTRSSNTIVCEHNQCLGAVRGRSLLHLSVRSDGVVLQKNPTQACESNGGGWATDSQRGRVRRFEGGGGSVDSAGRAVLGTPVRARCAVRRGVRGGLESGGGVRG
jgi:hypothetical protein